MLITHQAKKVAMNIAIKLLDGGKLNFINITDDRTETGYTRRITNVTVGEGINKDTLLTPNPINEQHVECVANEACEVLYRHHYKGTATELDNILNETVSWSQFCYIFHGAVTTGDPHDPAQYPDGLDAATIGDWWVAVPDGIEVDLHRLGRRILDSVTETPILPMVTLPLDSPYLGTMEYINPEILAQLVSDNPELIHTESFDGWPRGVSTPLTLVDLYNPEKQVMNSNTLKLIKQNNKKPQAERVYGEVFLRNPEDMPLDLTPIDRDGDIHAKPSGIWGCVNDDDEITGKTK